MVREEWGDVAEYAEAHCLSEDESRRRLEWELSQ